jgi:hypothetical protein
MGGAGGVVGGGRVGGWGGVGAGPVTQALRLRRYVPRRGLASTTPPPAGAPVITVLPVVEPAVGPWKKDGSGDDQG